MANKLKRYTILILLMIGLVFLGIGCTGTENNESSSPAEKTPAGESEGILLKGSGYDSSSCTG